MTALLNGSLLNGASRLQPWAWGRGRIEASAITSADTPTKIRLFTGTATAQAQGSLSDASVTRISLMYGQGTPALARAIAKESELNRTRITQVYALGQSISRSRVRLLPCTELGRATDTGESSVSLDPTKAWQTHDVKASTTSVSNSTTFPKRIRIIKLGFKGEADSVLAPTIMDASTGVTTSYFLMSGIVEADEQCVNKVLRRDPGLVLESESQTNQFVAYLNKGYEATSVGFCTSKSTGRINNWKRPQSKQTINATALLNAEVISRVYLDSIVSSCFAFDVDTTIMSWMKAPAITSNASISIEARNIIISMEVPLVVNSAVTTIEARNVTIDITAPVITSNAIIDIEAKNIIISMEVPLIINSAVTTIEAKNATVPITAFAITSNAIIDIEARNATVPITAPVITSNAVASIEARNATVFITAPIITSSAVIDIEARNIIISMEVPLVVNSAFTSIEARNATVPMIAPVITSSAVTSIDAKNATRTFVADSIINATTVLVNTVFTNMTADVMTNDISLGISALVSKSVSVDGTINSEALTEAKPIRIKRGYADSDVVASTIQLVFNINLKSTRPLPGERTYLVPQMSRVYYVGSTNRRLKV